MAYGLRSEGSYRVALRPLKFVPTNGEVPLGRMES